MPDKILEVSFKGPHRYYFAEIDGEKVLIHDQDLDGEISDGDRFFSDGITSIDNPLTDVKAVFKKYAARAQALVTQFHKELPTELARIQKELKDIGAELAHSDDCRFKFSFLRLSGGKFIDKGLYCLYIPDRCLSYLKFILHG